MGSTTVRFADVARALAAAARGEGLRAPSFRTPPRRPDSVRTVRRRGDGSVTVAVALHGRPWPAVLADLVEGVVVTNRLTGGDAMRARAALWSALGPFADAEVAA